MSRELCCLGGAQSVAPYLIPVGLGFPVGASRDGLSTSLCALECVLLWITSCLWRVNFRLVLSPMLLKQEPCPSPSGSPVTSADTGHRWPKKRKCGGDRRRHRVKRLLLLAPVVATTAPLGGVLFLGSPEEHTRQECRSVPGSGVGLCFRPRRLASRPTLKAARRFGSVCHTSPPERGKVGAQRHVLGNLFLQKGLFFSWCYTDLKFPEQFPQDNV